MSKRANIIVDLQKVYLATGQFAFGGINESTANAAEVIEPACRRRSGTS